MTKTQHQLVWQSKLVEFLKASPGKTAMEIPVSMRLELRRAKKAGLIVCDHSTYKWRVAETTVGTTRTAPENELERAMDGLRPTPACSPGFYVMNDSTEWYLDSAPKGSPAGMKVLRVLCGGKQVFRRVLDEHDRQALGKMLLEGES